jgi:hypothetical protein
MTKFKTAITFAPQSKSSVPVSAGSTEFPMEGDFAEF